MYFHTDSLSALELISALTHTAHLQGSSLRIDVDDHGNLRMKVGGGMWTAPIVSTPDNYREPLVVEGENNYDGLDEAYMASLPPETRAYYEE